MPKPRASCDACRKAKLGCDATLTSGVSCFNCVRRGKDCSVAASTTGNSCEQQNTSQRSEEVVHLLSDPVPEPPRVSKRRPHPRAPRAPTVRRASPSAPSAANDALPRQTQARTLHLLLWDIFQRVYEPRLGLFTGSSCCPYVGSLDLPRSITRLAVALDSQLRKERGTESVALTREIDQCHLYAIYAFASRWLPVTEIGSGQTSDLKSSHLGLRHRLWDVARQHILVAISHPTYRSAQALHLFASSGAATHPHFDTLVDCCHDIGLQHHERLRLQALDVCTSDFSFFSKHSPLKPDSNVDYSHVRDILFWSGVLTDVWRAAFYHRPPILLPGRRGETRVWMHVREHLGAFDRAFATLRQTHDTINDSLATVILQHASACKSMFWYSIYRVLDSLIHHVVDDPLDVTFANAMSEKVKWERMFESLVDLIERDYVMLNAQSQISCFLVIMHFNTGVLHLLDIIDDSGWHPPGYSSFDLEQVRLSSTRAIVNDVSMTLRRGLRQREPQQNIMLADPYPETAADCLLRCGRSLVKLHCEALLTTSTCKTMLAIIFEAMDVLSVIPGRAASNRTQLERLCVLHSLQEFPTDSPPPTRVETADETGHETGVDHLFNELASTVSTQTDLLESILSAVP